jgi:iron complex transport system permease protein
MPRPLILLLLALLAVLAGWLALGLGVSEVGWSDIDDVLRGTADERTRTILLDVRLPRVLLGLIVGAALSVAGVAFQAILRNPLADPFILGVSGGAALGGALFVTLAGQGALLFSFGKPLTAFGGALATLALLFRFARVRGRTGSATLLLVGVVLNAVFSAVILFLLTAGDPGQYQSVLFCLVGSVGSSIDGALLALIALFVLAGVGTLATQSHRLNLLSFGEESAGHLGVRIERTIWIVIVAASLITAAAVAFTGLVGFVGLIVPHILRTALGPDHRLLVPAAALFGAAYLSLADTLARIVVAPVEMPVGVVTTLIGGPAFLLLFLRRLRAERGSV